MNDVNPIENALLAGTDFLELLPVGIILFNEHYDVVFHNQNVFSFGVERTTLKDEENNKVKLWSLLNGFPTEEEREQILAEGAFEKELKSSKTTDGGEISLVLKLVAFYADDEFRGGVIVIEDLKIPVAVSQKKQSPLDDYYEAILDSVWSLFILITPDGKIQLSGGNKINSFRKPGVEASESIYDFFREDLQEKIIPTFRSSILKKKQEELIFENGQPTQSDAEDEYFECQIIPFTDGNNKVSFAFISIREITTFLKMIEKYKKENTELLQIQRYSQNSSTAVFAVDKSGKIVHWNRSIENLFGLRRSEVFGKDIWKIIPYFSPDELNGIQKEFQRKDTVTIEDEFQLLNSEPLKLVVTGHRVIDEIETAYVFECSDVSNSAREKLAIQKELDFYSNFYNYLEFPAVKIDFSGKVLIANTAFEKEFGIYQVHTKNIYLMDLISNDYLVKNDLTFKTLFTRGEVSKQIPIKTKTGKERTFVVNRVVMGDKDDAEIGLILRDVDEQLRFEEDYQKLKTIFEISSDGLGLIADSKFILVNLSFASLLNFNSIGDMINMDIMSIVAPEDVQRIKDIFYKIGSNNQNVLRFDFLAKRNDGAKLYLSTTVTPFLFKEEFYYLLAARDITELKRVQEAIKESEERYRGITENIDDFFWSAERINNRMVADFYSTSVKRITGYSQEDFLSDKKFLFRLIYPDDFKLVKEKLQRFYHNIYKRGDEIEFRILNKIGNIVWVRNKITVVRDRKGVPIKIYGLVSDISSQKKAEENVQHATANLQKLNETKDKFISIVSHDLRTPFSSVLGFTDLILNEEDLTPEEIRQYIQYIQESAKNMLHLVNSLLDWTRIQTGRINFEPAPVFLKVLAQKVLDGMAGFAIQKGIKLANRVPDDISLMIDSNLIIQAINNLFSNSLKFTPEGGEISISAVQSNQPRFIQVTVADTGKGIKPEDISKIFSIESKFTTEGTAGEKGTGLGLTLVKEIVEKHGGKIWVDSQLGEGAKFQFTLPKASAVILLIDDSNTDRILYSKILKNIVNDYDVVTANNGREALDLLHNFLPALILCDHSMPVMGGFEFVERYNSLQIKGKPPIIILSGDVGKSEQITYSEMGIEYVFNKPVNLTSFKTAVEKSLKQIPR